MSEMLLAATSGAEQIYFVIDPKDPTRDGVVVTETSVRHVPFWSYVTRIRVQPIKTSDFLQGLWDFNGPKSSDWINTYLSRTEPFSEEVIKQIKPFLVDVPRRKEPKVVDDGLLPVNQKSLPSQVQTKAGRSPLRQEPYDPDARDGDNDGIVQEGTPWERPAATRFLNEVGEQIERGLTSTTRPKGKLVDADGNEVDYTPTYERAETGTIGVGRQIGQLDRQPKPAQPKPEQPAAAEPGKKPADQPAKPKVGTPLADHGAGSLKEQGLQSVRQTAAPQPPPEPKPSATETPAAPVRIDPELAATEVAEVAALTETLRSPEEIEKKNAEILEAIKKAGGSFAEITDEYAEADANDRRTIRTAMTPKIAQEERRKKSRRNLERLKTWLDDPEALIPDPLDPSGFSRDPRAVPIDLGSSQASEYELLVSRMHPDLVELIRTTDTEDLIAEIEASAVEFHEGLDQKVHLRLPAERLNSLFKDGRYKTTHEVVSDHSQFETRAFYEASIGIPLDATAEVRPASGYMLHPDAQEAARLRFKADHGREPTEYDPERVRTGAVTAYGYVEAILKPEVAGRTAYGRGDSLTNKIAAVRVDSDDKVAIANAVLNMDGKYKDPDLQIFTDLAFLEASRSGRFDRVYDEKELGFDPTDLREAPNYSEDGYRQGSNYYEALIAGSFDLADIEEVVLHQEVRSPKVIRDKNGAMGKSAEELLNDVQEEFVSLEALKVAGLTEDEIKYLQDNSLLLDQYGWENLPANQQILRLMGYRNAMHIEEQFVAGGVTKVRHLDGTGKNIKDVANYPDANGETDPANVLKRRTHAEIAKELRRVIELHKNPPERIEASDDDW